MSDLSGWHAHQVHRYTDGPTACVAKPNVVKSIRREIERAGALSTADVRLASAMRLVRADTARRVGLNDGLFYPPGHARELAGARRAPLAAAALAPTPGVRKLHALALLVDFTDNAGTRPAADFERLLFDQTNPGSMASYYKAISGGQLDVSGEAVGYLRMPHPYAFYTNGESGMGETTYPQNGPGLLFDALTELCKNDSLARFDTDSDGYVDGIFLIHAGGGAEAEPDPDKRKDMIWSHKWVLPAPFDDHGTKVYAYSTEPEDGRVGVFAHEFGHVLGLPDLYDTSYRSAGAGQWCLMAGGSWGGQGNQPTRMSCWCLSRLGWIAPRTVARTAGKTFTLDTLANDPTACLRVWKRGASGAEYFLLENRQKAGQDSALPGNGLAVWHVDETQSGNTNPLAYLVGLVQADGRRDLELDANPGDAGDLFPGTAAVKRISDSTTPGLRANDGSTTGIVASAIREAAGVVSLRLKV